MRIYRTATMYYRDKQDAIKAAKRVAAPKWNKEAEEFRFHGDGTVDIEVIELSNLGHAVEIMNGAVPAHTNTITVVADLSVRQMKDSKAEISYSITKGE